MKKAPAYPCPGSAHPLRHTILAVVLLGVLSLIPNISTMAELSGQADATWFFRLMVSKALNTGIIWAGLGVYIGWLWGRVLVGALAAALASAGALVVHYSLGNLIGIMEPSIWAENLHWFAASFLLSAPLGVVGVLARRQCWLGLLCRLVVPLGAIAEPFVVGMFRWPARFSFPWPQIYSSYAVGAVSIALGIAGAVLVLARWRRK